MKAKGFCLLLLLLLLPCIGMAETHTVENEGYALTIDGETMALTMLDKASGKLYASGADPDSVSGNAAWKGFLSSSFSIDYVSGTSTSAQRADVCTGEAQLAMEKLENGADFTVDFPSLGQKMKVEIRLEADGLSILVPGDAIQEYGETQLCGLYLLPCFGAARLNEQAGYMLIPEAAEIYTVLPGDTLSGVARH